MVHLMSAVSPAATAAVTAAVTVLRELSTARMSAAAEAETARDAALPLRLRSMPRHQKRHWSALQSRCLEEHCGVGLQQQLVAAAPEPKEQPG